MIIPIHDIIVFLPVIINNFFIQLFLQLNIMLIAIISQKSHFVAKVGNSQEALTEKGARSRKEFDVFLLVQTQTLPYMLILLHAEARMRVLSTFCAQNTVNFHFLS